MRASATKGFTGHALGAAGILEATITLIAMEEGFVPATLNSREAEPICAAQLAIDARGARDPRRAQQLVRIRRQQLHAGVRGGAPS